MKDPSKQADEPPCECPSPGYCSRYSLEQTEYAWRVCRNDCTAEFPCNEEKSQRFRKKWARGKGIARKAAIRKLIKMSAEKRRVVIQQRQARKTEQRPACVHLGKPTGEVRECKACSQTVSVQVHACAIFGQCLPVRSAEGVRSCRHCDRYSSRTSLPVVGDAG